MNTWTFQTARESDWTQIAQLLRDSDLPLDGAEMHIDGFLLAYDGQTLAGCAALERYGDSALLRSVATDTRFRGRGLGQALVRRILDMAHSEGIKTVILLTATADKFFPRFGFRVIAREEAPEAVKVSAEFQGACPESAITMRLRLA
jgi:amino-acid N-acetyltransferase